MKYSSKIREEELKNKVATDFFNKYNCDDIIKDTDFAVKAKHGECLLWAEAKAAPGDVLVMLAQLVLTIGKACTFNEALPPKFLGCFNCVDKIINNGDFWKTYGFDFEEDKKGLKLFILKNFMPGGDITKIRIDKNNFLLETNYYELDQKLDDSGFFSNKKADFTDMQKAHNAFWAIYERPPREAYWDYIIERRDLLVPQDVRERKGSFFTPKIWVELSQKYIVDALGENWQEEYYVWDCIYENNGLFIFRSFERTCTPLLSA